MRYTTIILLCSTAFWGCESRTTGNVDGDCNPDGSCNGEKLTCLNYGNGSRCRATEASKPPPRCNGEADCFCRTCAESCGAQGFKTCTYSDTTTWGAKPAICECR